MIALRYFGFIVAAFCGTVFLSLYDSQAALPHLMRQFDSRTYPHASGRVISSGLIGHHRHSRGQQGDDITGIVVRYSYDVGGETYQGARLCYGAPELEASDGSKSRPESDEIDPDVLGIVAYAMAEQECRSFVANHPAGASTEVFYDPQHPADSLLYPGLHGDDLRYILFLVALHMAVLTLWIVPSAWLRRVIFKPEAGGLKLRRKGNSTCVQLPDFRPGLWGAGVTGAMSLFAAVYALLSQWQLTVEQGEIVLGTVLICGLAVYFGLKAKIWSGAYDLIIDEAGQTIELPGTFGGKDRPLIRWSELSSIVVESTRHYRVTTFGGSPRRASAGYTYAPMLRLTGKDGASFQLGNWRDQDKAEAFVEWLRNRIQR